LEFYPHNSGGIKPLCPPPKHEDLRPRIHVLNTPSRTSPRTSCTTVWSAARGRTRQRLPPRRIPVKSSIPRRPALVFPSSSSSLSTEPRLLDRSWSWLRLRGNMSIRQRSTPCLLGPNPRSLTGWRSSKAAIRRPPLSRCIGPPPRLRRSSRPAPPDRAPSQRPTRPSRNPSALRSRPARLQLRQGRPIGTTTRHSPAPSLWAAPHGAQLRHVARGRLRLPHHPTRSQAGWNRLSRLPSPAATAAPPRIPPPCKPSQCRRLGGCWSIVLRVFGACGDLLRGLPKSTPMGKKKKKKKKKIKGLEPRQRPSPAGFFMTLTYRSRTPRRRPRRRSAGGWRCCGGWLGVKIRAVIGLRPVFPRSSVFQNFRFSRPSDK